MQNHPVGQLYWSGTCSLGHAAALVQEKDIPSQGTTRSHMVDNQLPNQVTSNLSRKHLDPPLTHS